MTGSTVDLDVDGPAAPPRSNGELVFSEPWESRTFGMAMALSAGGLFEWDEFRAALIARIRAWEAAPPAGDCWSYYRCWQQALEDVLTSRSIVAPNGVSERAHQLAERPAGYDHAHAGHSHDDGHHHDH